MKERPLSTKADISREIRGWLWIGGLAYVGFTVVRFLDGMNGSMWALKQRLGRNK